MEKKTKSILVHSCSERPLDRILAAVDVCDGKRDAGSRAYVTAIVADEMMEQYDSRWE